MCPHRLTFTKMYYSMSLKLFHPFKLLSTEGIASPNNFSFGHQKTFVRRNQVFCFSEIYISGALMASSTWWTFGFLPFSLSQPRRTNFESPPPGLSLVGESLYQLGGQLVLEEPLLRGEPALGSLAPESFDGLPGDCLQFRFLQKKRAVKVFAKHAGRLKFFCGATAGDPVRRGRSQWHCFTVRRTVMLTPPLLNLIEEV